MTSTLLRFARNDDGAVTVDWVVLTAFIVTIGAVSLMTVTGGARGHGDKIGTHLTDMEVDLP